MYIPRILTKKLKEAIQVFPAVLITGPRQSGKTTFVLHELKDSHAYVTFDDPLNRSFALNDPKGFLAQYKDRPLILDEIQYVPEILSYIKIEIDKHHESGAWVLTGSQQFQFMRNISETLAGRIATLELPPFNFKEASYNQWDKLNDAVWNVNYTEKETELTIEPWMTDESLWK